MIYRIKKNKNYFHASNIPFQDERLGFNETAVMGYLLSKPDDWTVTNGDLARRFDCHPSTVKRAMKCLKKHGYIRRYKRRNPQTGQYTWHTDVYEAPDENPDHGPPVVHGDTADHGPYMNHGPWTKTHGPYMVHIQSTDLQSTNTPPRARDARMINMINALVDATGMDGHRFFGELSEEADELLKAGHTADTINRHYGRHDEPPNKIWWWYRENWKGRKRDFPALEDIWRTISGATKWRPLKVGGNGHQSPETTAAWESVLAAVSRHGSGRPLSEWGLPDHVQQAIIDIGGSAVVCRMTKYNRREIKSKFMEAINA